MSQTKHKFEVRGKSKNFLFVTTQVCLIHSVNKSFMFNISYFVIVLLMLCVGFFFFIKSSLILNQPLALILFQEQERSNVKDQNKRCRCEIGCC